MDQPTQPLPERAPDENGPHPADPASHASTPVTETTADSGPRVQEIWDVTPDPTQDSRSAESAGGSAPPYAAPPLPPYAAPRVSPQTPAPAQPYLAAHPSYPHQPAPAYPQAQPYPPAPGSTPWVAPPPNHLVWAILTTLLCFLPFGIVSIVKATSVNTLWAQGRWEEAHRAADSARTWAIWAAVVVPIFFVGMLLIAAVTSVTTSGA